MVIRRGASGPFDLPGYPEKDSKEGGAWTVTERYWVDADNVTSSLPAHGATTNQHGATVTDPDGNTLTCRRRLVQQGNSPDTRIVELTYSRTTEQLIFKRPADNPRQVRLSHMDAPINDARLLDSNGGPFTQAQIDDAVAEEYETLPLPVAEYTYTDVNASFVWSEANITANLFAKNTPTGISSPTAGKWLLVGREIDETENETVIRTNWNFCNSGWKES